MYVSNFACKRIHVYMYICKKTMKICKNVNMQRCKDVHMCICESEYL